MHFAAIVLAGGRGARLGGADKAALEVGGATLLDRALAAVAAAADVVVVGEEHPTPRPVRWTREHPAYGGPVAGLYAGLDALARDSPVRNGRETPEGTTISYGTIPVVVLAVDMPGVSAGTVGRLLGAVGEREGAVLTAGGRRHLAMVVRADALARVRPAVTGGAAVRDLWARLDLADVPARGEEARDVDTPEDLAPRS